MTGRIPNFRRFYPLLLLLYPVLAKAGPTTSSTQQPSLVCPGQVNVNLKDNCQALLQPEYVLNGSPGENDWADYRLVVNDGEPANGGLVDGCGRYVYEVFGPDEFSCWGYVEAEDKQAPTINCPDPVSGHDDGNGFRRFVCEDVQELLLEDTWQYTTDRAGNVLEIPEKLAAVLSVTGYPGLSDNCGDLLVEVSDEIQPTDDLCEEQVIYRRFTVTDHCKGLVASCIQEIHIDVPTVADIVLPAETVTVNCEEDLLLDEHGYPHPKVTGYPVLKTALGVYDLDQSVCNLGAVYKDVDRIDVCGNTYKIIRHWQLLDWCRPDELIEYSQVIKIEDTEAPEVQCPVVDYDNDGEADPLTFSTGPFDCTAAFEVPLPLVSDNCSDWTVLSEILIGDENGPVAATVMPGHSRFISGIPLGCHLIRYTVTDACDNKTVTYCSFIIEDQVAPRAVANDDLHISVGDQGYARVSAAEVDEGSSDNCGPIRIEVRRKITDIASYSCLDVFDLDGNGVILNDEVRLDFESGDPDGDGSDYNYYTEWAPFVEFSCCDINREVRIEMRVWDDRNGSGFAGDNSEVIHCIDYEISIQSDNHNTSWLDVLVEDKVSPDCIPPGPARIDCDELPYNFDPYDTEQMEKLFGLAEGYDNCPEWTVEELEPDTDALNDCHSGGFVRYFQVTDGQGIESEQCEQLVTILPVRDYRIKFPADAEAACGVPNADTIVVSEAVCDLLAVSVKEETFSASGEECYKLFRTYSVINWCEYDGESDPVVVSRDEDCDGLPGDEAVWVIVRTMQDEDPCGDEYEGLAAPYYAHVWYDQDGDPFNHLPMAGTKAKDCDYETNPTGFWKEVFPITENEGEDTDYYPVEANGKHCDMASVGYWQYTQVIKVYDEVDPIIQFYEQFPFCSYSSDLDTGCPTEVEITFTIDENCTPEDLEITAQLDAYSDGLMDEDLTASISGTYPNFIIRSTVPLGDHAIRLRVADGCGNQTERSIPFEVVDCKAPSPICINGLAVELMPVLPPADVDGDGEEDAAAVTIWASDFLASPVVDCSGDVTYSINLHGKPARADQTGLTLTCSSDLNTLIEIWAWDDTGYGDFCETYLFVQDNMGQCPVNTGALSGAITLENELAVEGVEVELSGEMAQGAQTEWEGQYAFDALLSGFDYTITPTKAGDALNGVSTFDLIVLSKHILGITPLDSPYRLIAADINNDGRISAVDAIGLRRVILNIDTEFTQNSNWRFIPKSYAFPDPAHPWAEPFPEVININKLEGPLNGQDFVAVKMGDLNGSVKANALQAQSRTVQGGRYALDLEAMDLVAGKDYEIDFRANDIEQIQGFQGTISFDPTQIILLDVLEGMAGMEHFGFRLVDEGLITFSWHHESTVAEAGDSEVMFRLKMRARSNTSLEHVLRLSSRQTVAEAYSESGELLKLELTFNEQVLPKMPELYQNHPNPFREETLIGFYLPAAATVDLRIHDAAGRLLQLIRGDYSAGSHTIAVSSSELEATGVLYYSLISGDFSATRRMVMIDN